MNKSLKYFNVVLIIILLSGINLNAQNDELPEVTLENPHNTIKVHLIYLQDNSFQPEKASQTLNIDNPKSQKAKELAIKLKKYMDAEGLFVIMDKVPDNPDYIDSATNSHKYILFQKQPKIYLEKIDSKWYYSKETVEYIPELYKAAFPSFTTKLMNNLPAFFYFDIFGLQLWQIAGLIIYLLLGSILFFILNWIFSYIVRKIFSRFKMKDIFNRYVQPVSKPISTLAVILIIQLALSVLQLPVQLSYILNIVLDASIPILLILIAYRLVDLLSDVMSKIALKTSSTVDDNLVPLIRKTIKVAVVIIGAIYFVSTLGWDVTPLIAGASVGGLAFALAAQDTIKNFFGSITIFTDQPFEVGDWIIFDGGEGMVEEVGVRSTRIRTFYNSLISLPNGKLSDALIDNMGRREHRRYFTNISITYDTPPDLIDAYVEGLKDIVKEHPITWKDYYQIHLNNLDAASINILFYIFFDAKDWTEELEARHQVIREIIALADKLGVRFAFPTQTLHIEEMPGQKSLTPVYKENKEQFLQKVREYQAEKKKSK